MADIVCSFCGQSAAAAGQLFENEDQSAAICSACVSMFAQNVSEVGEAE